MAGDARDVLVEGAVHISVVAEDEGLVEVEADGDDILGILAREFLDLLDLQLVLEQKLFIVYIWVSSARGRDKIRPTRELDNKGDIKDFLHPSGSIGQRDAREPELWFSLCEDEGYHVAKVHAIAARTTSGVQEERLPLLVAV